MLVLFLTKLNLAERKSFENTESSQHKPPRRQHDYICRSTSPQPQHTLVFDNAHSTVPNTFILWYNFFSINNYDSSLKGVARYHRSQDKKWLHKVTLYLIVSIGISKVATPAVTAQPYIQLKRNSTPGLDRSRVFNDHTLTYCHDIQLKRSTSLKIN